MRKWIVLVGMLTVFASRVSQAQTDQIDDEIGTPPPEPPQPTAPDMHKARWYGWQTLLVDATAVTAFAAHPAAGLAAYAFAPPVVHAAHRNDSAMLMSVGLRVGVPIVGGVSALGLTKARVLCPNEEPSDDSLGCSFGVFALAFMGGMVSAIAVDAAVLSRDPPSKKTPAREEDRGEPAPEPAVGVRMAPMLGAARTGFTVGINGAF